MAVEEFADYVQALDKDKAVKEKILKAEQEQTKLPLRGPQLTTEALKHRFAFHAATTEEKRNEHTSVRQNCLILALFINEKVPEGREKALAITALEEVMMWANAGIARNG